MEQEVKKSSVKYCGKVVGCKKLRVRQEPSVEANVVCLLNEFDTVTVIKKGSTKDFWKVQVGEVNGYCMKSFIEVKVVTEEPKGE